MKRNEIIGEHKKGVRAVKYNAKPKTYIEPQKPRNFVAKNATTSGAGAHADKKKAAKQGQTKHKGQMDMAETYGRRRDAYQRDYDSSVSGMGKRQSLAYQLDGGANDEGWDDEPRHRRHEPAADVPHDVYIDGRKWKTFDSASHASNVARKLQAKGKKATVQKSLGEDAMQQLTVAKDDDKSTELIDKTTGVTQTIDKTNPNAPRLAQDPQGKLMLTKPGGQATGAEQPPNYMGKTVSVTPEAVAANAASGSQPGDEEDSINTKSVQEDNDILAMIRKVRV